MSEMQDRVRAAFIDETLEILSELEISLLQLEEDPGNMETISSVFRSFHTIKGSGGMAGFDEISQFTHDIENVYDLVRSGGITAGRPLIDLTLASCDLIREMIKTTDPGGFGFRRQTSEILLSFSRLLPEVGDRGKDAPPLNRDSLRPGIGEPVTYRIRINPSRGIFSRGINPVLLLNELRGLGKCSVFARMDSVPDLRDLDPEACYVRWDVVLTTDRGVDDIRDIFIFAEEDCELQIDVIDDTGDDQTEAAPVSSGGVQDPLSGQEQPGKIIEDRQGVSRIRVSSDKLDSLVNLVGELVTVQARLSQASAYRDDPELLSIAEEVERLTGEIRDETMNMRMLPIGTTFSRFRRLLRDLSRELGKEVGMLTEGAATELDKTVIEKLNDPLMHLIRNCIDHGIEPPQVREAAGKTRKGTVHLSARHSGPFVLIKIRDDGAGLDRDLIRSKALERGIIMPGDELTEKEIFSLICVPGFSTAGHVTNVSGRGVGMDAVKKAVDSLRGSIDIESEKGSGTTITLSLPLTLAIIDGLLVRIGQEMFVFPLSIVEECVELTQRDMENSGGRHIANVRGTIVPYINLREQFLIPGEKPAIERIVIVSENGSKVGFLVDEVIGNHQTVIKTLGRALKDVEGISGATILGDGSVALILDIPKLLTIIEKEEVCG